MESDVTVAQAVEPVEVSIGTGDALLTGTLTVPPRAQGIVLFAHGSGSSRQSPRNMYIAAILHCRQFATLLFDLLTNEEESIDRLTAEFRFDIPTLARRLAGATSWVERSPEVRGLPIAYFGASTGAAAALVAAAQLDGRVKAVVSRGGRPDLAGDALEAVRVPTLFIVGEYDRLVLDINRKALERLGNRDSKLAIVRGVMQLFEEPDALEEVARAAGDWFQEHLAPSHRFESELFANR